MRKRGFIVAVIVAAAPIILSAAAAAQDVYIDDILTRPERFYNRIVTLIGQVQSVATSQGGLSRGSYAIIDDSTTKALTVKTNSLPRKGKIYKITGRLIADPAQASVPVLMENERSSMGGSSITSAVLLIGGTALVILLAVFFVLLSKSGKLGKAGPAARPASAAGASGAAGKTQVFLNLGASLVVEKGADQGKEFPLHTLATLIGRAGARKNEVELADETVSKIQATLRYDNTKKEFTLVNESATNPTTVNGQPVTEPTVVAVGSTIEIGKVVLRLKKG